MTTDTLIRNREAYKDLAALLDEAGLAEHALFLNWGYLPDGEKESAVFSPGGPQARLARELLDGTSVDGRSVLDVGCGRGGLAALLASEYSPRSVTGVDLSPANIAFCRTRHRHPRLRFQIADACRLPQPDGSIDVLCNLESSGAYADLPAFFGHVHRILKSGGDFLYGDVFSADTVALIHDALRHTGFTLISARSINAEVATARRMAGSALMTRLEQAMSRRGKKTDNGEMQRYFATPGSAMFNALQSGAADYHLFHWQKPHDTAIRPVFLPASLSAALALRSQRLEQCLNSSTSIPTPPPAQLPAAHKTADWFPLDAPDKEAELNVFALPYAGGGASVYREWGKNGETNAWPKNWNFCAVQLPGRETRIDEDAITDMSAMVSALAQAVTPYAHKPWALVGCSLGCKIAFELARHMEAQGQGPKLLFLLACPAPSIPLTRRVSTLDETAFVNEVRQLGGTPHEVLSNIDLMQAVAPALRGDSTLAETYVVDARIRIDAPIILTAASDDIVVSLATAGAWEKHTRGRYEQHIVDGGHFFIRTRRDELQDRLVRALRAPQNKPAAAKAPAANLSAARNRWLPFGYDCPADHTRLFCFHHAGGTAAAYRDWIDHPLLKGIRVCPIELPGRGSRFSEPAQTGHAELADAIAETLIQFRDTPFALFGHSLGSLIAFETALRLQDHNVMPLCLFASGRRPPHAPTPEPLRHRLSDSELTNELRGLAGTPPEVFRHAELLELFLPALRADFTVTENYPHTKASAHYNALSCPLIACVGDSDDEVAPSLMKEWLRYTQNDSAMHVFPGGHFYLQENVEDLLKVIREALKAASCRYC